MLYLASCEEVVFVRERSCVLLVLYYPNPQWRLPVWEVLCGRSDITSNDDGEIAKLRAKLSIQFEMKDLGEIHYFLDFKVENVNDGILVSQRGLSKEDY